MMMMMMMMIMMMMMMMMIISLGGITFDLHSILASGYQPENHTDGQTNMTYSTCARIPCRRTVQMTRNNRFAIRPTVF